MRSAVMVLTAALLAAGASPVLAQNAPPARKFVEQSIKSDNSEIMLGRMAEQRGASRGVREFGHTLVQDHKQAKQQMKQVADRMGIRANGSTLPQAQDEQQKLSHLHGRAFDREFVNYMVNDHQQDIRKFENEASSNRGRVSKMAAQQLPTLRKHLHIAKSLQI